MNDRDEPLSEKEKTIVERHRDIIEATEGMDIAEVLQLIGQIENEIRRRS
ncbi:hypothetical protein [Bradyrhizobium sp. WSM2793]|nr:hypothetical protein [Bradyrhizobium sp. WSM2793]